jgi:hypothetical protein
MQFDRASGKPPFIDVSVDEFEARVNAAYDANPSTCLK